VIDGFDDHSVLCLVDPIDDPVVPATGAVEALELEPKRMTDSVRSLRQWSVDELDGGEGDLLR
jgi:hypothetical protein